MENMSKAAIIGHIVLKGDILLKSPLLIGDGTGDESYESTKDIHVLKNKQQQPFIPGTSLAGVLRDYVLFCDDTEAAALFGNADTEQSLLQISDVVLENAMLTSRDGVKIDSVTGTAVSGAKFDYEAVDKGASGQLRIGITLRKKHENNLQEIRKAFIKLRNRLEAGIAVGSKTATGFGRIELVNAVSGYYNFSNKADVKAWLLDYENIPENASDKMVDTYDGGIGEGNRLVVDAVFSMRSSMIIRDLDVPEEDRKEIKDEKTGRVKKAKISAVFKRSGDDFVIPGTSLKGVLRSHAAYVLDIMGCPAKFATEFINNLMGYSEDNDHKAKSRLYVDETYIKAGVKEYAQPRTRIDRITGGVVRSALFSTKPIWQEEKGKATVHIHFEIKDAKEEEVGLALLLLRDMWLGKVAIGGEKSIGRGTLSGISAKVSYNGEYELAENGKVITGDKDKLESYVKALCVKEN